MSLYYFATHHCISSGNKVFVQISWHSEPCKKRKKRIIRLNNAKNEKFSESGSKKGPMFKNWPLVKNPHFFPILMKFGKDDNPMT